MGKTDLSNIGQQNSVVNHDDILIYQALDLFNKYCEKKNNVYSKGVLKPNFDITDDNNLLKTKAQRLYELYLNKSMKKKIILFFKYPNYGQYGINTYLNSILNIFPHDECDIIVCYLDAMNRDFFLNSDYAVFYFPRLNNTSYPDWQTKISKAIFYYMATKIGYEKNVICHFNLYGYNDLIKLFKEKMNAKTIFTVHYTSWGLNYRGDIQAMKELLRKSEEQFNKTEREIIKLTEIERKSIINSDYVIAPSLFTINHLRTIYNLKKSRIIYIPHSVERIMSSSMRSQNEIRSEYGFKPTDKIVLFVGRLDENKGLESLISVFIVLRKQIPQLRLIVAGEGNFHTILKIIPNYERNNIMFVGFVDKMIIDELLTISDIGVVPSYYEEFGYTAVEMLSTGMPVICSNTSGLQQLKQYWDNVYFFKHDILNNGLLKVMKKVLNKNLEIINQFSQRLGNDIINSNFLRNMKKLYNIPK